VTSLLGKLVRLFPESVPLEDLFTEAVARLFERRPELCVAWLEGVGLLPSALGGRNDDQYVSVSSQRAFAPLEHHDTASRPDLFVEVYRYSGDDAEGDDTVASVVMVESKIGSGEGQDQLRRYAEHLDAMVGYEGKALLYLTRAYDPKDEKGILTGLGDDVRFEQLRWHDFYRFLQAVEKDALVEEVMAFMEEQGMARSYRFSTTDLAALSGIPRAFEIMEETLGGEVKAELESFAGNKSRHETISNMLRTNVRYVILAQLHGWDLFSYVGYRLRTSDGYPLAYVNLQTQPGAVGREVSIAAMRSIALRDGWESYGLDDPRAWAGARRTMSLAAVLREEDHVAAVQLFFVESIRQLREELTAFKKEHPELPWDGGS
jgi:PD-(D/E)XK nuclease superfamily